MDLLWIFNGLLECMCPVREHQHSCRTAQMIIFHQPRFSWNKGSHFPSKTLPFAGPRFSPLLGPWNDVDLIKEITSIQESSHFEPKKSPEKFWNPKKIIWTIHLHDFGFNSCSFYRDGKYFRKQSQEVAAGRGVDFSRRLTDGSLDTEPKMVQWKNEPKMNGR